jgi:aryl-alcohol dehydrogenase-like predicted oxidoreductase
MKYNRLGHTDLRVSELGLGCQSLGGGLHHRDRKQSIALVRKAFDEGVTFFDTSDHYSQGLSEQWLGEALEGQRQKVILATKAGTRYTPLGSLAGRVRPILMPFRRQLRPLKVSIHRIRATRKRQEFSAPYLIRSVDNSLRRLNTDYLDLFQLHKPPANVLAADDWRETLERLRECGKIRSYGISCATVDDAVPCLDMPGIAAVQVGVSLLDQAAITKFLGRAEQRSLGVIVRNPRAQGHLTTELSDIMAETYAKSNAEVAERKQRAESFSFLASENRTLAQAALQFVLQLPGVTTAIPRAINVQQLMENLGALKAPSLTGAELARIAALQSASATTARRDGIGNNAVQDA